MKVEQYFPDQFSLVQFITFILLYKVGFPGRGGGGGGRSPQWTIRRGSARKGYPFQVGGI